MASPAPGDVTYPKATEAARAAIAVANLGGEEGPALDRTRPPWVHLLAENEVLELVPAGVLRTRCSNHSDGTSSPRTASAPGRSSEARLSIRSRRPRWRTRGCKHRRSEPAA
jgi:hypothetical protein